MNQRRTHCAALLLALFAACGEPNEAAAAPGDRVAISPDVVYGHKAGMALTFDVYRPPLPNGKGVLYLVSSVWYSRWTPVEESLPQFDELLDRGFTVFRVRHGSSPYFKIPEIFGDVQRAVRFIRKTAVAHGVDPQRLGVYGGSAGGHLALLLATSPSDGDPLAEDEVERESSRVAAVVAFHPPVDLRAEVERRAEHRQKTGETTGGGGPGPALDIEIDQAKVYSPWLQVSADDPPALLVHGDQDTTVPLDTSRQMYEKLRELGVPAELLVLEGAGHVFEGDHRRRARQTTADWFARHLLDGK